MRCLILLVLLITGCSGGAVVFAPTPPPPDLSPLSYDHPGGAFSITVPRHWAAHVQNTTALAAAAFSAPGDESPTLRLAVVNLGESLDSEAFGALLDQYQREIRTGQYTEVSRQAMGDGSWRLTGLQHRGGLTQPVNTFIQQDGGYIGVIEIMLPGDSGRQTELQAAVNTFTINPDAGLQPTDAATLGQAAGSGLDILHVSAWTTPAGVFFITGEVANTSAEWAQDVPVRAVLLNGDGLALAEAVDTVMGYALPPGGFAPFSLRFGGGMPREAVTYQLILGGNGWQPGGDVTIYGQDELTWTDESSLGADGRLTITGTVSNTSAVTVYAPRLVLTVFDDDQNVIAAAYTDINRPLNPGASADFQIIVPEMGGEPAGYIVNAQAQP